MNEWNEWNKNAYYNNQVHEDLPRLCYFSIIEVLLKFFCIYVFWISFIVFSVFIQILVKVFVI